MRVGVGDAGQECQSRGELESRECMCVIFVYEADKWRVVVGG